MNLYGWLAFLFGVAFCVSHRIQVRRHRLFLKRFEGREPLDPHEIYARSEACGLLEESGWIRLFLEIADIMEAPPALLCPGDRFTVELAPPPRAQLTPELDELVAWYASAMDAGSPGVLPEVENVGEMIRNILIHRGGR